MKQKISNAKQLIKISSVDAMLFTYLPNIAYLSGFTGSTATVLITLSKQIIFVDFRYVAQAKQQCDGFDVMVYETPQQFNQALTQAIQHESIKKLGFEQTTILYSTFLNLKEILPAELIAVDTSTLRAIKTDSEKDLLRQAIAIGDQAFELVYPKIKPNMKESEVVNMLYQTMRSLGATHFSFDPIVASGIRGCLPHGKASDKVIEADDMVTLDWGVIVNGYCSDCTRTFAMSTQVNPTLVDIYHLVLKAQQAAVAAIKPGVSTHTIDAIARNIISEGGYGEQFKHGTGHGLGVEVHEYPRLNTVSDVMLLPGMVVTVEPGIYVEGLGGVRIEDVCLVTEDGVEILTKLPKHLQYKSESETI